MPPSSNKLKSKHDKMSAAEFFQMEMPSSSNKLKGKHDKMSAAEFFQMEMESEQPLIEIQVAEGLRGNGQIVQVVQETRLATNRQKSACAEDEQNDKDSDSSGKEEQPKDIMKVDFDALIKKKTENQLIDIASSFTRQYTHTDFPSKASKLLKRFERIWKKYKKQAEKIKDGKCGKCKKVKKEDCLVFANRVARASNTIARNLI